MKEVEEGIEEINGDEMRLDLREHIMQYTDNVL